jgi:hypothetical protein
LRYFFVTGIGRSGSSHLADLLNRASGVHVAHEPFRDDFNYLPIARCGRSTRVIRGYLENRRSRIEAELASDVTVYGEVNSLLRYFLPELSEVFEEPLVALLVRNGRDFVRSAYVRTVYTEHTLHAHIVPEDDDPWAERWSGFSRFERLCWYWDHTNGLLLDRALPVIRLEEEARDLGKFRAMLLNPLGLSLQEEVFLALRDRKRNTTAGYLAGLRREKRWWTRRRSQVQTAELGPWSQEREEVFQAICGETMARLGYR